MSSKERALSRLGWTILKVHDHSEPFDFTAEAENELVYVQVFFPSDISVEGTTIQLTKKHIDKMLKADLPVKILIVYPDTIYIMPTSMIKREV